MPLVQFYRSIKVTTMINILVPTDFTVASVSWIRAAVKASEAAECNVILFHAFAIPDSPFDLLASDEPPVPSGMLTDAFRVACKQAKLDANKSVRKIVVRTMRGNSKPLFRNFIDANEIDMIYFPEGALLKKAHPSSLDPLPLFKDCGAPLVREYPGTQRTYPSRQLEELVLSV
jgi:hypothetical protein